MVRGQYMAGTGMLVQRRQMEVVTNNMVNVETQGYKKEHFVSRSFDDVLIERINDSAVLGVRYRTGPLNFGTQVDQVFLDFTQGYFEETQRNSDLAIAGDGFYVVETEAGERYTRTSAFVTTVDGYLTDGEGHYLLGTQGRVYVGNNGFSVDELGNVNVGGEVINRIRLVSFADNDSLRKQGSNLFTSLTPAIEGANGVIKQGFLENSNVEVSREMVDMMTTYRAYEANQRILTMTDETVGKAVNEIGRLR